MVPDTLILAIVALYIGSVIDFRREIPTRIAKEKVSKLDAILAASAGIIALGAVIFDIIAIFIPLQADSGEFDITRLSNVNWLAVGIVSAACFLLAAVLFLAVLKRKKEKSE